MKKHYLKATALPLVLAGWMTVSAGCSTTSSENVKTSGIWAHFLVEHYPGGEVLAWAVLRVGGSTGTIVDLTGGEHIECNGTTLNEYFDPITNYHWSRRSIPEDADGLYEFVFVRLDETVPTEVTMPAWPEITGTDPTDGVLYAGDPITVYWDASEPAEGVDVYVEGPCIENVAARNLADEGEYTFVDGVVDADPLAPADCNLTLTVLRYDTGEVDSAYQGGYTEANRLDAVSLSFLTLL